MILADRLRESLLESGRRRFGDGTVNPILEILDDAHKFVFPERTGQMAEDAVAAPEKIAKFITLPYKNTWIEFEGPEQRRFGVLTNCPNPDRLMYATAIVVSLDGDELVFDAGGLILHEGGFPTDFEIQEWMKRRYIGAITLMGAPDLIEKKTVTMHRLNKQRAKKNRLPLLDHDVVNLRLTKYEKQLESEAEREEREGAKGHSGIHKRRHFVRAHIRILANGRVTKVRPHYRGDASLGEPAKIHIVRV